ncbi:DUF262 domain-containing protein [Candidatus Poribacteria bacterium]|nr:DUF262 domain-containing protein [Candidatus Poribacteria bacterium]
MPIEDEVGQESSEVIPFRYAITSYGADYPVDSLVKRLKNGAIFTPTFQRKYVWKLPQASKFIESLLLGLPVPGVFFARDEETQKLLIIDGQQRLLTLQFFYEGIFAATGRQFQLTGVQEQFKGLTYKALSGEDRLRLDDSIIHATITQQDEPSDDNSSIYHIFERLNTGGTPLSSQEIRACIYHGPFSDLLKDLNKDSSWRAILGRENTRMKDQELILRFLALTSELGSYARPMKGFLNTFMGRHRWLKKQEASEFRECFENTIEVIYSAIGKRSFKPFSSVNAAVFDAVMVGVARRLESGHIKDVDSLRSRYEELLSNTTFHEAYQQGTADETKLQTRADLAIKAFGHIQ